MAQQLRFNYDRFIDKEHFVDELRPKLTNLYPHNNIIISIIPMYEYLCTSNLVICSITIDNDNFTNIFNEEDNRENLYEKNISLLPPLDFIRISISHQRCIEDPYTMVFYFQYQYKYENENPIPSYVRKPDPTLRINRRPENMSEFDKLLNKKKSEIVYGFQITGLVLTVLSIVFGICAAVVLVPNRETMFGILTAIVALFALLFGSISLYIYKFDNYIMYKNTHIIIPEGRILKFNREQIKLKWYNLWYKYRYANPGFQKMLDHVLLENEPDDLQLLYYIGMTNVGEEIIRHLYFYYIDQNNICISGREIFLF